MALKTGQIVALGIAFAGIGAWFLSNKHALPTQRITVDGHVILVEVADDAEERAQGLMYRDSMPADEGMLFVYDEVKERSFWMKNTRIPLAIAYIDDDGTIKHIAHMKPLDTKSTPSLYPVRYALEMNDGWFKKTGVNVGAKVTELPKPKK